MYDTPWDAHADTFARCFDPLTRQLCDALFRLAEPSLHGATQLLDVACGCGARSARPNLVGTFTMGLRLARDPEQREG